ncbi:thioesterase II family protein [Pseudomonas sp. FYR_11]|uniref:thioesterase II family protein n=1 Tax=Pseudomonas TaxID=286 RepID=UPI00370BF085
MTLLNLLCLPYSGASAMVYTRWRSGLPAWIRVCPVELPGHGARMGEVLQTELCPLVRQLALEQCQAATVPYALFGHSVGALLAFELVHELRHLGCPEPLALFVSGMAAPTRREDYHADAWREPRSDCELIADLRSLDGTADDLLANQDLMNLMLPIVRADFLLCGRYVYLERKPLACALHVLAGQDDRATGDQLQAWRQETTGDFSMRTFPGKHFFIHHYERSILDHISEVLASERVEERAGN